jgi:N-acetylmuramoyl-L-alanine amidase
MSSKTSSKNNRKSKIFYFVMAHDSNRDPKMKSNRGFLKISIAYLVVLTVAFMVIPLYVNALSSKDKYLIAESCYNKLKKDPSRQKYRDQWMMCISKYQDVFRNDPHDPWAAAGLYMSGVLYHDLFKMSGIPSDQREATDTFQRIIKRYPSSKYKQKAIEHLNKVVPDKISDSPPKKLTRQDSKNLPSDRKDVQKFEPLPDIAAVPEGGISIESDKNFITHKKSLKYQTRQELPSERNTLMVSESLTDSVLMSETKNNRDQRNSVETNAIFVTGLRYWSNPNYTRLVIDADGDTSFEERLLKPDPALNTPRRLYIDLANTRLGKDMEKIVPINDDLLKDARAGQYTPETVRVVVDIKTFKKYKIFPLKNPFRIVIDVWGTSESPSGLASAAGTIPIPGDEKVGPGTLARQLALGVSRIVVDPGHGGKDFGAPGYIKGVHEKEVVLQMAKRLEKMIQKELGCKVYLTRSDDRYLTLEERTAIANTKEADLFISLHTNAHKNNEAYGIETYFLNLATDDEAIRVAAMENATSRKNISDLQTILTDLMQNTKINESARLASFVQGSLNDNLSKRYDRINNKGVKQAPFYVLLGAQMPAILVEAGFISNPRECKRLLSPEYQDHICRAIVNGIRKYIKDTNPAAILTSVP